MSMLTGFMLAMSLTAAPLHASADTYALHQTSISRWEPRAGDKVIVDTKNNQGYIIHTDGLYINFPVATGQRKWVYYIGRSYNASTPNWDWEAQTLHHKWDKVTFGPSGRFLRLYKDGEINTAYGFHEYRTDEEMFGTPEEPFADTERYKSMGCVILTAEMMDLVVATWEVNGQLLPVKTVHGIENLHEVILAMSSQPSV